MENLIIYVVLMKIKNILLLQCLLFSEAEIHCLLHSAKANL
jgi:hypothetical protein